MNKVSEEILRSVIDEDDVCELLQNLLNSNNQSNVIILKNEIEKCLLNKNKINIDEISFPYKCPNNDLYFDLFYENGDYVDYDLASVEHMKSDLTKLENKIRFSISIGRNEKHIEELSSESDEYKKEINTLSDIINKTYANEISDCDMEMYTSYYYALVKILNNEDLLHEWIYNYLSWGKAELKESLGYID